ncbi:MAG: LuxR C-terminal-related transcriptional regulator [Thermomicrobiales bacterium]
MSIIAGKKLVEGSWESNTLAEAPEAVTKPSVRLMPRAAETMPLEAPPQPLTSFLGRDRATATVLDMIVRPEIRLVTLTGPGGIGKTRLAIQVANEAHEQFPDGIAFVALSPLTESDLVLPTIAQAIGVVGPGTHLIPDRLARALDHQRMLIVIDNFEHVAAAAGQLATLMRATREVRFLVTSRVTLHISGEHEFAVPPLELPASGSVGDLSRSPACALFEVRTRAVRGEFAIDDNNSAAVVEICRRLGGVPLAIELAAARGKALSPPALLERLSHDFDVLSGGPVDQPSRHQTMRAAIQWSYDLLPPEQQQRFRQLSLFAGGCSLEAAQAVSAPDRPLALLPELVALIDASLLLQEPRPDGAPRYWMLDLIRRFGIEQLTASGERDATVDRFTGWLTSLAERAGAAFVGNGPGEWAAILERELPNVRVALAMLDEADDTDALLRLIVVLGPLWSALGHQREGLQWLTQTLDRSGDRTLPERTLHARILATRLATTVGDFERAAEFAETASALAKQRSDPAALADTACTLGNLARGIGDQQTARHQYENALAIYRELGDRYNAAYTLIQLAKLGDLGTPEQPGNPADLAVAEMQCDEALEIYRALGNQWGIARALNHLAYLHYKSGRYQAASVAAGEALPLFARDGNLTEGSQCIENLADIAGATGNGALGARLYGIASGLQERLGAPMWPTYRTEYEQEVARARALLTPEAFAASWQAGRELPDDLMVEEALAAANFLAGASAVSTVPSSATYGLTARELEVLSLLATGASNQGIADALFISLTTVKGHVQSIMRKLDLSSRTALAAFAVQRGLLDRP